MPHQYMASKASEIGSRLKEARERKGMSQAEAARHVNVDTQTISRWERGAQRIRAENLIALSELYGEDLRALVALGGSTGSREPKRSASTPKRVREPRPPAYAGLSFNPPIAAQRSRLWLEGFLLELAESGADAGFLQRLEAGVRAIISERDGPAGLPMHDATREAADAGRGHTGRTKEK